MAQVSQSGPPAGQALPLYGADGGLSPVRPTEDAPEGCAAREDGWRALRVAGRLEFSLAGILARLSNALAAAGASLFAASACDADSPFVTYEKALDALRGAGCGIEEGA